MRSRVARIEREAAQRLGQRERVAGRDEQAVDAVAHDVAIAGDVGGEHRRRRGERLGQDHAEALAVQRGRAEHVRARELGELALVGDLAERLHAAVVEHHVRDLLGQAPTSVSVAGTCSRSASNARSSTGRPLRSTAWPMNRMRSCLARATCRSVAAARELGLAGMRTPLGTIR